MQFLSRSPSLISVDSDSSYYPAQVLCDTDRTPVNLAGLYRQQRQLAIHSIPPHPQPCTQMSSVTSYNTSNKSLNENPVQLLPQLAPTPAPLTLSPCTIQMTLQTQPNLDATLLCSIANGLLQMSPALRRSRGLALM
jgi:hypothetical protein